MVAWAKPGACQRITLPVCLPTSGLWFSAWFWLRSWPSMHYRSARRGKKRGHPPTSWSQTQKVLFMRLILRRPKSLGSRQEWHLWKKNKKKKGEKYRHFLIMNLLFIWCIVRLDQYCDEARGFKKDPWLERPWKPLSRKNSSSDRDTKTWRTKVDHVKDLCTVLSGRNRMNNIIKRRRCWQ